MSDRLAGRTRWSHASKCPRMAAMGLLGAVPEEPSERQKGRMQRGKDAQRYFAQRLDGRFGEGNVVREKAVPWPKAPALPVGELHTDFFIKPEAMAMECKSSEAVDSMFTQSMLQVKGQVYFDDEAEAGALVFLDRDYQETDIFPVLVTEEDVEVLEGIAAQVVEAGKTGVLPERTCENPGEGIGKFCPFIEECFAGWEPTLGEDRPDLAPLATEFYLAKQSLEAAKAEYLEPPTLRYEAARDALLAADPPAGATSCGALTVKRTDVRGSQSFSLTKAKGSGVWQSVHDEVFDSFIKTSDGHVRLAVERVSDEPLVHDFDADEEAPF